MRMRPTIFFCVGNALLQSVGASVVTERLSGDGDMSLRLREDRMMVKRYGYGVDDDDNGDDDEDDGGDGGDNSGDDNGDDTNEEYLFQMCLSNPSVNETVSDYTQPCQIFSQMELECMTIGKLSSTCSNSLQINIKTGATDDLEAPKECMCGSGSGYFDMLYACNNCYKVHGGTENSEYYDVSAFSSASKVFCSATPATIWLDVLATILEPLATATSSGTDLFPSQTAVSDYFTGTLETKLGEITGDATLKTFFPEITNVSIPDQTIVSSSFESTSPVPASITSAASTVISTDASSSSSSASATATATGNGAADRKVVNGMIKGMVVGAGIMLLM